MLSRTYRLTSAADISATLAQGQKLRLPHATASLWITGGELPARLGLAVGKPVGNSVVRSRVSRCIRHGFAPLIAYLPRGTQVVVRAFAGAQRLSSADWTRVLTQALQQAGVVDKTVDVLITTGLPAAGDPVAPAGSAMALTPSTAAPTNSQPALDSPAAS